MPPVIAPILIPAAIMGVALVVSWGAWRRRHRFSHGHWGGVLGIAGAYFMAHVLLVSWPGLPPDRADDWQAWSVIPLALLGFAQRWWGARRFIAVPIRAIVSGGILALLLRSQIDYRWLGAEAWYWLGGLTVAATASWQSLERLASFRGGASLPLCLWSLCAFSAAAFALSGSAFFGQLGAALAGAFGASVAIAWWSPGITLAGGPLAVFAPLFAGLLARAHFHAELPALSAALIFLAPFALWWGERRRVQFQRPWKGALVRLGLVSAPLIVALVLAYFLVFRSSAAEVYAY
jgi:hypothetical protein